MHANKPILFILVSSPVVALFGRTSTVCEKLVGLALAFYIPFNLLNILYPFNRIHF